ncbi:TIGR01555 family protein [Leptospira weilii serovar Topaz str. LT2116]|uniref:TIGR01555 family protein n=1 Tax=Leptospira weilii serovar Topaz str. LT2116 TaxID=1088540 RepID=M3GZ02_9LEPT|nr:TIGR01555 family protein [Leptospira weilii serovar Topaz str. LT2116]
MSRKKKGKIEARFDGLADTLTGRGTEIDKLKQLKPVSYFFPPEECRAWYRANGFFANIVDAPAEDATREWITIKTNMDGADNELNVSRLIINRLEELKLQQKLKDLIRFSRLYQEGGFLFYGLNAPVPQTTLNIMEPVPNEINKIAYINVFGPDRVALTERNLSPLAASYHIPDVRIDGYLVHDSRYSWLCPSYVAEDGRGVSVIETVITAIIAQDTALHSISSMLYETGAKVFKSKKVDELGQADMRRFLRELRAVLSSQSLVAIDGDEELVRLESNLNSTGLKDSLEFIFENLAGLSRIPKSRLNGQAQGTITSGQFDFRSYYDDIARDQENDLRPIIEKAIKLIIRERQGEIYRKLNGQIESLDWQFEFNPLWKLSEKEEAEIDLIRAREVDIYMARGSVSPEEARPKRFSDLEKYPAWNPNSSPEFGDPQTIQEPEAKPDPQEQAKDQKAKQLSLF